MESKIQGVMRSVSVQEMVLPTKSFFVFQISQYILQSPSLYSSYQPNRALTFLLPFLLASVAIGAAPPLPPPAGK